MMDWLRDKTRDNLARDLNSLGITTIMAERGRAEEKIEKTWYQVSLGIIDIPGGAVRWVNILRKNGGESSAPQWWVVFGIPDERLAAGHQEIKIKTKRKKSTPLFGRVVDVTWEGYDSASGLLDILSQDEAVRDLAQNIGNLSIRSSAKEYRGWTLQIDKRFKPTDQSWAAVQKIAKYLLTSRHV